MSNEADKIVSVELLQDVFDFLEERYGNTEGLDWGDDDAAAIGDMLHKAINEPASRPPAVPRMRCPACNAPRKGPTCWKCRAETFAPAPQWIEPALPDVAAIRKLAMNVGYAIGVHGSQERDLDLIAAPWTSAAVAPSSLMQHIAEGMNGRVLAPEDKPLGRKSCNIQIDGWFKLIDLSVCPAVPLLVNVGIDEATGADIRADLSASPFQPPAHKVDGGAETWLPDDGAYLIFFDDADRRPEMFAMPGARDAAMHRYAQVSVSWNAHLFVKIDSNSRDCSTPNATPPQAAARCEGDEVARLKQAIAAYEEEAALRKRDLESARRSLRLARQADRGDVWHWQNDGHDNLQSMSSEMAVLIHACHLKELLAAHENEA